MGASTLSFTTSYLVGGVVSLEHGLEFGPASPENKLWLRFRDAYGAVWALRIAQRVNDTARQQDWDGRLTWSGLEGNGELRNCLTKLLRPFVGPPWLASSDSDANEVLGEA